MGNHADLEAQEYRDRGFVYRIEALERANNVRQGMFVYATGKVQKQLADLQQGNDAAERQIKALKATNKDLTARMVKYEEALAWLGQSGGGDFVPSQEQVADADTLRDLDDEDLNCSEEEDTLR